MGFERGLSGRPRVFAAVSGTARGTACEVSRMAAQRDAGCDAHWTCLRSAFVFDGSWIGFALRAFRPARMDSRTVLRDWGGRQRDHHPQRAEADAENARQGLFVAGAVRGACRRDPMDKDGDGLAVPVVGF